MKFKSYHKIKQFKDIVRQVTNQANFKGLDEDGQAIYEETEKPIISFKGTVKLHGTNAGICYNANTGIKAQKRSQLINNDSLNAHFGFNHFVLVQEYVYLSELLARIWMKHCSSSEQLTLYGEWAGKEVQKGIAISELNKAFYIFDCKVYDVITEQERWIDISNLRIDNSHKIYNIHDFPTFNIEIDFNNPKKSQNKLIDITTKVEKECPVGKQLGITGIGEGVVWTGNWEERKYIFKVKGKKHSTSKVKTLASVDFEVLKTIDKFVEYACTINRIEQGIKETNSKEKKDMPDLLRWIANDILSEESEVLTKSNLEWKQVARECAKKVRSYFFNKLEKV